MNWIKEKWRYFDAPLKKIRSFGFILSALLFIFGTLAFLRGHFHYRFEWPLGAIVLWMTLFAPRLLSYVYRSWMIVAERISWVVLRVLLAFLFYVVFSPVSILLRLTGKDLLDERINSSATSYWKKRNKKTGREHYEKLF